MADYVPTAAADLRLERGAVVAVADKPAHGWWEGWNSRGEFGRFPGNYVELTPAADGGGGGNGIGERRPVVAADSRFGPAALAWLTVPMLPATNVVFTVGTLVAERLLYTPSVGFCLLVGHALFPSKTDSAAAAAASVGDKAVAAPRGGPAGGSGLAQLSVLVRQRTFTQPPRSDNVIWRGVVVDGTAGGRGRQGAAAYGGLGERREPLRKASNLFAKYDQFEMRCEEMSTRHIATLCYTMTTRLPVRRLAPQGMQCSTDVLLTLYFSGGGVQLSAVAVCPTSAKNRHQLGQVYSNSGRYGAMTNHVWPMIAH